MNQQDYHQLLDTLPTYPGVYRFIGADDVILYVGKAKNLKNRVSNYFTGGKSRSYKVRQLVQRAARVEYTVVDSEHDALLLENNLIKEHQPRYNVNLRDDKTYTYICVKNERFPRVFFTRRMIKDGSTYYGPYSSKHKAAVVFNLIKRLYPLRTCKYNLSERNIKAGKFKVCLEYHLGNCLGPCVGYETEDDYHAKIKKVKSMLGGRIASIAKDLKQQMKATAAELAYEKAAELKEKLDAVMDYQSKSVVSSQANRDIDIFAIIEREQYAYITYIMVIEGRIVHTHSFSMKNNLDHSLNELLAIGITHSRDRLSATSDTAIVAMHLDDPIPGLKTIVPSQGEDKRLLDMAQDNAYFYAQKQERDRRDKDARQDRSTRILEQLRVDLNMPDLPTHIECFDNSNLQGTHPVASCVVFKHAKPSKKDYRRFHIKTVVGPDDFASMEEIVHRRYKRLLDEEQPLPQLVIIDGGKGQLSAAMKSIHALGLTDKIAVIGVAKRLEEIFRPGSSIPLLINKKSESLKLIQQLRNEAHRFAITFHRDQRSKSFTQHTLLQIPGVGPSTAKTLLKAFGSINRLRKKTEEEIAEVVRPSIAAKVYWFLRDEERR